MPRILIVDDSPTIRRMVRVSLAPLAEEATFLEAASGLEAIECVSVDAVDLKVLVLNMPDMHGREVLDCMRGHQRYRRGPVVVLTTRGDDAAREDAFRGGASAFMTKPFAPQDLLSTVRQLVAAAASSTGAP
jgi:two-component system chemotaxis response regulator CheY